MRQESGGSVARCGSDRLVKMGQRRLVAPEHDVGLGAGQEAGLDAFADREILVFDDVQHELQVAVPVASGLLGLGRRRRVERQLQQ